MDNFNLQNNINDEDDFATFKNESVLSNPFLQGRTFKFILMVMAVFGGCFVAFIFMFQVVFRPISVAGYSMQPEINAHALGARGTINTDTVYYQPVALEDIKYKDIVIVNENYSTEGHSIIKRVIATPNQTITFKTYGSLQEKTDGKHYLKYKTFIDGIELEEQYIKDGYMEFPIGYVTSIEDYQFYDEMVISLSAFGTFSYTLKDDEFFIMGDNRNNSTDSRYFGAIKYKDIIGKAKIHVPYGSNLAIVIWNKIFNKQ